VNNVNENKKESKNLNTEFYTAREIRSIIGCGKTALYNLLKDENFPSVLIGNRYYVPKEEFERWYRESAKTKNTI
jgi:predicted DNA-binding transcriptional regulator AlpA